jgi:hypothetical protein
LNYKSTKFTYFDYWKGKVVPVHAMKGYKGCGGTAPLILNFSNIEVCVELHDLAALLEEEPPLPTE